MPQAEDATTAVVRKVIEYIRSERLAVGDRLPSIRQFSELWDLRPSAVRDGVLRAETMGLIRVHPRSGAFVQSLDFSALVDALAGTVEIALMQEDANILELISARRLIEVELVAAAAVRRRPENMLSLHQALKKMEENPEDRAAFIEADERFHLSIAQIEGNSALCAILRALLVLLRPYRMSWTPTPGGMARTARLHQDIYRSIMNGDADGARSSMREHLTDDRERALAEIKP